VLTYFCHNISSFMQTLRQISQQLFEYANSQNIVKAPTQLYTPIDYILQLGGKRLRPALVLMANNLFQDNIQPALPAAFALELFHNFTLIHDDIMDNAPLRRGMPTVHEKFSMNTGILSGDAMLILAYDYLMRVSEDTDTTNKILRIFNRCAIEVCEGQQYDIDFEQRNDVTIPEYITMITLKTSVLLAAALEIGAIIGKSSESDAKNLYEFGKNIGIAFQLQDDLLDTFGNPAKFGKKVGGDIIQNKKTYLYLKCLENASEQQRNELLQWYSVTQTTEHEASKISAVKQIFLDCDILNHTKAIQEYYYQIALQHFEALTVPSERKETLLTFANELFERDI
jgi:geranylgeranyl diphosphate synthase, type II